MTAKRFEMGYDDGLLRFVKDNVTNTNLDIVDCWTVLNELNDENEELKLLIKKVLETTPIEHSLALDLKNSIRELYK